MCIDDAIKEVLFITDELGDVHIAIDVIADRYDLDPAELLEAYDAN